MPSSAQSSPHDENSLNRPLSKPAVLCALSISISAVTRLVEAKEQTHQRKRQAS